MLEHVKIYCLLPRYLRIFKMRKVLLSSTMIVLCVYLSGIIFNANVKSEMDTSIQWQIQEGTNERPLSA